MPKVLVYYHYYYPDDVVSAEHFAQLCEGLAQRGWEVEVRPANRGCRNDGKSFPLQEIHNQVKIERVWRPPFRQASFLGRLLNSAWMITNWSLDALRNKGKPEVVIVGTDPPFSSLAVLAWKLFRPNVKIAHWDFDMILEASVADEIIKKDGLIYKVLYCLLKKSYHQCDLLIDIGPCVKASLEKYKSPAPYVTMTPWALVEPDHPCPVDREERAEIFGEASLTLLYSGTFGRSHSYELFLELARMLKGDGVKIAFSVRGNRTDALKGAITAEDDNIIDTDFAPQSRLLARLSSADIHLSSTREEYIGVNVPSKFFGSLAVGRPVIFSGSTEASIAQWITKHQIGWVLNRETLPQVADELSRLATNKAGLVELSARCHSIYQQYFSKKEMVDKFDRELRKIIIQNPVGSNQ